MPTNHLILCHPLLLPSNLPSIRVFSNESVHCITWQKFWSVRSSISPSYECSGLISFRIDWLDLLAVQGTGKSLLQDQKKASVLQHFTFFMVQLSHPKHYWKNHSFEYMDIYQQIMSLLFNILSRLVIAFLLRNKHLIISQLQSLSAVILETPPKKVCHYFHCFPIYLP